MYINIISAKTAKKDRGNPCMPPVENYRPNNLSWAQIQHNFVVSLAGLSKSFATTKIYPFLL